MNEAAIAAQVATNLPSLAPTMPSVVQDVVDKQMLSELTHELFGFFDVPRSLEQETKDDITSIIGWITAQTGSEDRLDVLTKLRELEGRLGLTFREGKLKAIYNYLKLDNERRRIEREMSLV